MSEDFRSFLHDIEAQGEKDFVRISQPVDIHYEAAAILTKLERRQQLPVLLFENVEDKAMPSVVNCYATRGRVANSLGIPKNQLSARILQAYHNPIPPVEVQNAPVQEVILTGEQVDLGLLPAMLYHNTDGAPYITAGIVFAKDPDTGIYNLSYNRLMLRGRDELGIFMTVGKHLDAIYSKLESRDQPLEVAVSIGNHPAWALGALAIGPYTEDELGIIGGLKGSPLEMVKCREVDVMVPAGAEIVIEGEIEPHLRQEEGPFSEFTGYSVAAEKSPVIKVKAITHRSDPIYQDICGGNHREHLVIATIPMEANYVRAVRDAVPEVIDCRMAAPFTLIISMKKRYQGQARMAMMAAFAADLYLKHVIVCDQDINIANLNHVMWAVATRVQAARDTFIIPQVRGSGLDPSAEPRGVVDKMGIDATAKPSLEEFAPLNQVPPEVMERIRLQDYLGPRGGQG